MKNTENNNKKFTRTMLFRFVIRMRHDFRHFKFFLKWLMLALVIGTVCGLVGTAFHYCVDFASNSFGTFGDLLYLLPAAGIVIVFSYRALGIYNDEGTNSILRAARAEDTSAIRVTPLIFFATFLTHLCGGSAGREGAALQIGGSVGSFIGRKIGLDKYDHQLMVMCGMSATFCALFGTPLTAAFFSIEVAGVGTVFYAGLVPSVTASFIAMMISTRLGVKPMLFETAEVQGVDSVLFAKVLLLACLIAFLSILYCTAMHGSLRFYKRIFPDPYLRVVAGAVVVIIVTSLTGTHIYNGTGMETISQALSGHALPEAFMLKLILTALTLGCGFKGGEIIPTLFIGSTFGCTVGMLMGMDPVFAAELGLIGLFCGVVNCPVSSILLSVELFGSGNFVFFGITAAASYLLSGYYSLYSGQKFMNSKIIPIPFEKPAEGGK